MDKMKTTQNHQKNRKKKQKNRRQHLLNGFWRSAAVIHLHVFSASRWFHHKKIISYQTLHNDTKTKQKKATTTMFRKNFALYFSLPTNFFFFFWLLYQYATVYGVNDALMASNFRFDHHTQMNYSLSPPLSLEISHLFWMWRRHRHRRRRRLTISWRACLCSFVATMMTTTYRSVVEHIRWKDREKKWSFLITTCVWVISIKRIKLKEWKTVVWPMGQMVNTD